MSEQKLPGRFVPGKATPSPNYYYQEYLGKSGSASAKPREPREPTHKIAALQNFALAE